MVLLEGLLRTHATLLSMIGLAAAAGISPSNAEDADELSKQLANPVASLISVPFQNNGDWVPTPTTTASTTR